MLLVVIIILLVFLLLHILSNCPTTEITNNDKNFYIHRYQDSINRGYQLLTKRL